MTTLNSKLNSVVDALLDSAAREYLDYNISSVDNICAYASEAMSVSINDDEAKLIQAECKKRLSETFEEKVKRSCEEMFNDRIN